MQNNSILNMTVKKEISHDWLLKFSGESQFKQLLFNSQKIYNNIDTQYKYKYVFFKCE